MMHKIIKSHWEIRVPSWGLLGDLQMGDITIGNMGQHW